jgi:hypothetical protein
MSHPIRLAQNPSVTRQKLHTARRKAMGLTVPSFGYDGIGSDALAIFRNTGNTIPGWVAGYVDGLYAWTTTEWDLFNGVSGPATELVTIAVTAAFDGGDVLDVENGDASPGQTAGWISMRKAAGLYRPTIYCSAATVPAVRVGTGNWILNQDYDLWVADWVGHAFQYRCADGKLAAATQYASGSWADFDVAYDPGWPHRSPAPAPTPPPPTPVPNKVPEPVLQLGSTGGAVRLLQSLLNGRPVIHEFPAPLVVDGDFGLKTKAVVEALQRNNKLVVDGIVGPHTWGVLGNYS